MSTATIDPPSGPTRDAYDDGESYRALHPGAVLAPVAAVLSLIFPFMVASAGIESVLPLVFLPLISLAIAIWALLAIRSNKEYFAGAAAAAVGLVISLISFLGGGGYGLLVLLTEVPEGYTRASFLDLKPSDEDIERVEPIPAKIQGLLGEKVFIKGYMRPDSTKSRVNIQEFLLVRDNQQCCFGDLSQVQFFDQVQVALGSDLTTDLFPRVYRVGGVLNCRPGRRAGEPPIVYSLDADYIK